MSGPSVSSNGGARRAQQEKFRNDMKKIVRGDVKRGIPKITDYMAIDCEMVGVGPRGSQSQLARVSVVNYHGQIIYETFVHPRARVTDWRSRIHGIRPGNMYDAEDFDEVSDEVYYMTLGKFIVGHAVTHDLEALGFAHLFPPHKIRDTQLIPAFQKLAGVDRPSLKTLVKLVFGLSIQDGIHDSIVDARAAMALYRFHERFPEACVPDPPAPVPRPPVTAAAPKLLESILRPDLGPDVKSTSESFTRAELAALVRKRNAVRELVIGMVWGDVRLGADHDSQATILGFSWDVIDAGDGLKRLFRLVLVNSNGGRHLDILIRDSSCRVAFRNGVETLSQDEGFKKFRQASHNMILVGHRLSHWLNAFGLDHPQNKRVEVHRMRAIRPLAEALEPKHLNCGCKANSQGDTHLKLKDIVKPILGLEFDANTPAITKARAVIALFKLCRADVGV